MEDCLFSSTSDSEDAGDVKTVTISDEGSRVVRAPVKVSGDRVLGIVDTGADITIVGGNLFWKIALQSRLKKKISKSLIRLLKIMMEV